MRDLKAFLKQNKVQVPNVMYPASRDFLDEEGNPLEWELRRLDTKVSNKIKNECMKIDAMRQDVQFDQEKFNVKVYAKSVVFPDLMNAELQNSYGVVGEEALLLELLSNPKDFDNFGIQFNKMHGYDVSFGELVEEAKN